MRGMKKSKAATNEKPAARAMKKREEKRREEKRPEEKSS
jgi:hypothetical protein